LDDAGHNLGDTMRPTRMLRGVGMMAFQDGRAKRRDQIVISGIALALALLVAVWWDQIARMAN
jgi:hypothetical protein